MTEGGAAYYLDRAVMIFGQAVDGAIEEAVTPKRGRKSFSEAQVVQKTKAVLHRWLRLPEEEKKYRDPMAPQTKW